MGKKSKGKARKSKEERAAGRISASNDDASRALSVASSTNCRKKMIWRWKFHSCGHGVDPDSLREGSAVRSWIDKFLDALDDPDTIEKSGGKASGEVLEYALRQTYESHRDVWDSESDRRLVAADLMRRGTDLVLGTDPFVSNTAAKMGIPQVVLCLAGAYAVVVTLLERYDPIMAKEARWTNPDLRGMALEETPDSTVNNIASELANLGFEYGELGFTACHCVRDVEEADKADAETKLLLDGCKRSIVKFFARRVPCQCLASERIASKSQARAGRCEPCGKLDERRNLMLCSGCGKAHYCSRGCQLKDWQRHKDFCKEERRIRAIREAVENGEGFEYVTHT